MSFTLCPKGKDHPPGVQKRSHMPGDIGVYPISTSVHPSQFEIPCDIPVPELVTITTLRTLTPNIALIAPHISEDLPVIEVYAHSIV